MDNLLPGNRENILYLIGHERFTLIKCDVIEFISVPGHLDYILHFTSPVIPISPNAKTLLEWAQKVSRAEGLRKTVDYFKRKTSEGLNR